MPKREAKIITTLSLEIFTLFSVTRRALVPANIIDAANATREDRSQISNTAILVEVAIVSFIDEWGAGEETSMG